MQVCYFEVTDPQGAVDQPISKGPINVIEDLDLVRFAQGILWEYGGGNPGWTCRVWMQAGILPIPSGEPDAVVTA